MQVQRAQNDKITFQKLYMPNKQKFKKKLGSYAANEAEKARPVLKKLADDYDIFVSIDSYKGLIDGHIDIKVRELPLSVLDIFLGILYKSKERINGYEFYKVKNPAFSIKISNIELSEAMIEKTKSAIKKVDEKIANAYLPK